MSRSRISYSNIKELGRYFHISYSKAADLVKCAGFPSGIFTAGGVFPKAQIAVWADQCINPLIHINKATDKATQEK